MSLLLKQRKLLYVFAAFLLVFVFTVLAFIFHINSVEKSLIIEQSQDLISGAENILTLLKDAEAGQQSFLLTKKEEYLEPYFKNKDKIESEVLELKNRFPNKSLQQKQKQITELQEIANKLLKLFAQTLEQKNVLLYQPLQLNQLLTQSKTLMNRAEGLLSKLISEEKATQNQINETKNLNILITRISIILGFVFLLFLGILFYLLVYKIWEKDIKIKLEVMDKFALADEQLNRANEKITKQNELIKEQSEEKFKQILETLNEIVWSFEFSSVQNIFLNKGIEKITGKTSALVQTNYQIMLDITHPEDIHLRMSCNTELLEKGYTECTYRIISQNGEIRWFFDKILLRKDQKGKPMRVDGITSDITKFKQIEEEKNKLIQQLLHQNNDLRQFSFIVSHNMRAPIARILGLTNIIDTNKPDKQQSKEMIEHIQTTAKKLDEIIVDLNNILSNKNLIEEPYEEVEFLDIYYQVEQLLMEQIHKNKVTFVTDFRQAEKVFTIRSYLFSILYNLISNSIKYKAEEREPVIEIKTSRKDDYILLTVKDNGSGIDLEKHKNRLFALFQRIHINVEGKGIGLYLVKSQVEALEGKIEVESEPDKGSIFYIYLKKHAKVLSKTLNVAEMNKEED